MAGPVARSVSALLVVATLVGACTPSSSDPDPAPTPTPTSTVDASAVGAAPVPTGQRVAIIVGPTTHVAAGERAALEEAARTLHADGGLPEDVTEVRVLSADSAAFTADLVDLAVDDGYHLVCVVGTGTAQLLVNAARRRRGATFCGTDPTVTGAPANVTVTGVDPLVLVELGVAAIGVATAPVGLLASSAVGDPEAVSAAFVDALPEPRPAPPAPPQRPGAGATGEAGATPTPSPTPSATPSVAPSVAPSPRPAQPVAAVQVGPSEPAVVAGGRELLEAAPTTTLVLAAAGAGEAARALVDAGRVVVLADWAVDAEGELPANLLVALTVDWGVVLARAVTAALQGRTTQLLPLPIDSGVYGVLPGQGAVATEASSRVGEALAPRVEEPPGPDDAEPSATPGDGAGDDPSATPADGTDDGD